jgi:hypothetical protein
LAVLFTWRAAFCAAPTIFVLAGSAWMASHACQVRDRAAAAKEDACEIIIANSPADDDRMHRVALKHEVVLDLLDGRLTFDEAVARFRDLSASSAEALANLRENGAGPTDEERVVEQVLAFARVQVARKPSRYGPAMARLESEAKSQLARTVAR